MHVLQVSSEVAPFSKTGGLGDVLGALPRALVREGIAVTIVTPRYRSIDPERYAFARWLRKLHVGLDDPPYNFILHTSPFDQRDNPHYHWHIEITPTLGSMAGFEWGSGFYINPTPPEEAARFLRKV